MSTPEISPSVAHYDIPLAQIRALHPNKRLVVGVAIFCEFPGVVAPQKKLLLLQRSASEDTFPLMYEIPGGHAEDEDETILRTVVRETLEETGLVVKRILGEFAGFEYDAGKGLTLQINFMVEVESDSGKVEVKLAPSEHQAFAWVADGEDLQKYALTGSMGKVVADALKLVGNL